jgi:polyhydroxyalkanoate synthesis regulator protein
VRSLLADIKRVKDAYSGENITEAVILIIKEIISIKQLDYFVADNATTNDTAIRAILTYLLLKLEDPDSKRVRYLSYIINLAVKAFLFGKNADAFEEKSETKKKLFKLKAVREF